MATQRDRATRAAFALRQALENARIARLELLAAGYDLRDTDTAIEALEHTAAKVDRDLKRTDQLHLAGVVDQAKRAHDPDRSDADDAAGDDVS